MNHHQRTAFVAAGILMLLLGAFTPLHNVSAVSSQGPVRISVSTVGDSLALTYQIPGVAMTPVTINGESYVVPSLDKESRLLIAGEPDLPLICRSVIIPDTAKMQASVLDASYVDYQGINVASSKGNLLRTVDPATIPYTFGDVYTTDAWYPASIVSLREPYILRDYRGQTVVLSPVQYNPMEKTLRVYTHVTVQLTPSGLDTTNILLRTQPVTTVDATFAGIYAQHFLNYNIGRYTPVEEQGNMLIITYDSFYQDMVPFLQWKHQEGIPTEMVNVSTIGASNAIKSYIADYYNTNGLTFVLLVGDSAQVPTFLLSGEASDPSYSYVVGNDHYPDLFVGRFSAETNAQVQTQVQRSVEYERDPQAGADWYHKGIGIGSEYGVGDDNEYDWQHIRNIRSQLLNFTYTYVDEFYGGSQGGQDQPGEPSSSSVATALNDGRSILNYCGHGGPDGWGTSGFSSGNVNQLTNDNMLPFIDSVACSVGDFDGYTCFCEAWLRATHNGEPTGAIAHFGSSISQSWNPPMSQEDEFNAILTHQYPDNIKITTGGLYYNGDMKMNDDYGADGDAMTDYWILFGDPSLQVRTDTPQTMTVTHNPGIPIGSDFFDVTVTGIENALCAVSRNGELIGYAYTDASGYAHIPFLSPLEGAEPVDLIVTAFNQQTDIEQVIVFAGSPPNTPTAPQGPSQGNVNVTYSYSTVATDPDNDAVRYRFNWGDGTISDWIGPFPSGTSGGTSHAWTDGGSYNVSCQAKDVYGLKSNWSTPISLRIHKPVISIAKIAGSLMGITISVSNTGDANATMIPWSVTSHRALYGYPAQFNKQFAGNITAIAPGATKKIFCWPLIGIGMTKLTIHVYDQSATIKALVLGMMVVILPG